MDTKQVVTPTGKAWVAPAAVRGATGVFTGTFDLKTRVLSWKLTSKGVGDPSLRIVDIHLGGPGEFGAVLVRLCSPCESEPAKGQVILTEDQAGDLRGKPTWVTLLINGYPNGVIRGQIEITK